jgi:DNA modification methylase
MGMNMPELDRIYLGDSAALLEASRLNRKFIGIDINKDYVKMAEKRIAPELSQSKLF